MVPCLKTLICRPSQCSLSCCGLHLPPAPPNSAVAKRFLDAAANAVDNLPIVQFFRDSVASTIQQVTAIVSDTAMNALIQFAPQVLSLRDKVLPVITTASELLGEVAAVLTGAGEMLDKILEPAANLVLVADVLDDVDTLLGGLAGEEVTVDDVFALADSAGALFGATGADVALYINISSHGQELWDKAQSVVDMLGFKSLAELASDPVGAMRSAAVEFLHKGMSRLQSTSFGAITDRLVDLAEGVGDDAIALIAAVASGDGKAELEAAAVAAIETVVSEALAALGSMNGTLGNALTALTSGSPLTIVEDGIAALLAELTGPSGIVTRLQASSRLAIDGTFNVGSLVDATISSISEALLNVRGQQCSACSVTLTTHTPVCAPALCSEH